ncbi:hypothetical protein ACCO45_013990 [Purpureocillium lilacinum]|uniref:Uncharacterized protein n=1 Tax=Purpureocillium lilacinum TaxID=33203 RepID=A0ACC4D858_PURLI
MPESPEKSSSAAGSRPDIRLRVMPTAALGDVDTANGTSRSASFRGSATIEPASPTMAILPSTLLDDSAALR